MTVDQRLNDSALLHKRCNVVVILPCSPCAVIGADHPLLSYLMLPPLLLRSGPLSCGTFGLKPNARCGCDLCGYDLQCGNQSLLCTLLCGKVALLIGRTDMLLHAAGDPLIHALCRLVLLACWGVAVGFSFFFLRLHTSDSAVPAVCTNAGHKQLPAV